MAKGERYILTGNTYNHRDEIKGIGGKWNADRKGWIVEAGSMRERARQSAVIAGLRKQGVAVEFA